ncbi:hypothetical protein GCM10027321_40480 [Massilia terrae]
MTVPSHTMPPGLARIPHPFWLIPIGAVVGCLWFLAGAADAPAVQQAFIGAMWGAFGAVPLVIVAGFILIGLRQRGERAVWRSYGLDWYCSQFPEHARDDLSCRFCGAAQVQPRNLSSRGDARALVCGQCGQTLCYSGER